MAVYTRITEHELRDRLSLFNIGTLVSFEGISDGVENSNYHLFTTGGRYILTLFEKRVNAEELPFFISYMRHLRQSGIACPAAEKTRTGQDVFTLAGRPAIITTFLEGHWPQEITAAHCTAVGDLLARMHLAAQNFSPKRHNAMGPSAWRGLIHACAEEAGTLQQGLFAELDDALDVITKNWPRRLPQGAVHADLFPDNVFFKDTQLSGVIDFYFACTDLFVYDLMLTLNPWCFDKNGALDKQKSAALLAGYQAVRPLSASEISALPLMGRAAAVRIVATRLYDWFNPAEGALVVPKDPMEHVRIMRFHASAADSSAYGITP